MRGHVMTHPRILFTHYLGTYITKARRKPTFTLSVVG